MEKLLQFSGTATAYAHESFHYLVARALGLKAKVVIKPAKKIFYTRVDVEFAWQHALISLGPAAATPFLMLGFYYLLSAIGGSTSPAGSPLFWLTGALWLGGCWHDLTHVFE